jgi:hypothetical protein
MTTEELLDRMITIHEKVAVRVEGIGDHQYKQSFNDGTELQAFEDKPLDKIMVDTLEEIQDAIAYLMFLHIRVERLRKALGGDL